MRYTKNDIRNIPLTEFMAALGEKPVKAFGDMKLYYAPQRDDPEPMLVVDTNTNRWYDHATDQWRHHRPRRPEDESQSLHGSA